MEPPRLPLAARLKPPFLRPELLERAAPLKVKLSDNGLKAGLGRSKVGALGSGRGWGKGQTLEGRRQLCWRGPRNGRGRHWVDSGEWSRAQGGVPSYAPPLAHPLPTTDHTPSQSKGSLDRLDEKPLDLGPPLPPKAEAGTFGGDLQTPRPSSAGEVGVARQREGHGLTPA